MMASNLLSRLLPSNTAGRSIYDDLRAHDEASESDLEEHAGLALDEENLNFHDDDLHHADVFGEDSQITTASTTFPPRQQAGEERRAGSKSSGNAQGSRSKYSQSPRLLEEDPDDDVPQSLLIEGHDMPGPSSTAQARTRQSNRGKKQTPIPGNSNKETRAHWESTQAHQQLHQEESDVRAPHPVRRHMGFMSSSARDKALWRWTNVTDLDNFMREVYNYYTGAGIWPIILNKFLTLAQAIFVAIFTIFLTQCVDWPKVPHSRKLSEVVVPQCTNKISGLPNVEIWLFTLYVLWRIFQLVTAIPRLSRVRDFYIHLLDIPENDMQTVSWQDVVARIMALRDANPMTNMNISPASRKYLGSQSKQRLDAHDICNRLMRRENYLIALFNKDILDLTLPIPFLQGRQFFSRALLWNIDWCVMDLIFNDLGQVSQLALKDSHRRKLSAALKSRFLFCGFMNALLAPVIVLYILVVYFLRYFNEFKTNPSLLGSRQYTPFAEWKFREFNELDHLFHKRVNMSYPFASRYLDQFPKVKTAQFARFAAFILGAIVSVLAVASLWDPELFLNFEITSERTVLFYLGVFGSLWAVMNGSIPEENLVFEPEYALRNVIEYTHYMPNHWQNRLHSDDVKREFSTLYNLKVVIFFEEVFCIIVTPFLLWFSLTKCSDQIIDFFREFTLHVDGVGYVCSFAVFDFKTGNAKKHGGGSADVRDEYYSTKHGKMAASFYGFIDNYALNPRTGVQGHVPPATRHHQHNPPPNFPGLGSPNLNADMHTSRLGRSERRPGRANPLSQPSRTSRNSALGSYGSPIQSVLLDPHHQPSTSAFGAGGRSVNRTSRSRYQSNRPGIMEEQVEDEEQQHTRPQSDSRETYESVMGGFGMDESRWDTSGARPATRDTEDDEVAGGGGGVLGLLYQFQKAQTEGGVHM